MHSLHRRWAEVVAFFAAASPSTDFPVPIQDAERGQARRNGRQDHLFQETGSRIGLVVSPHVMKQRDYRS
jgi:hypothetical protein